MTRKHFQAIARIVHDSTLASNDKLIVKDKLVNELNDAFKEFNDLFNPITFKDACNVNKS